MSRVSVIGENPKPMLDQVITSAGAPEDILRALDSVGIEWHITEHGDLMIRYWQIGAEGFVSPEHVATVRMAKDAPRDAGALEWVSRHLEELRDRHPGRWIAVVNRQVVASAATLAELLQQTEREGVQQPFVTQIPADPTTWTMTYASGQIV